jgi:hypothetical protein
MVTETGDSQLDALDAHQLSWLHWDYKWFSNWTWDNPGLFKTSADGLRPCADRGNFSACLDEDQVRLYARPYAVAVAGTMVSFAFNASTAVATLVFKPDLAITAPTELFVPREWYYADGVDVLVQPAGEWKLDGTLLTVVAAAAETTTVTLTPAQ